MNGQIYVDTMHAFKDEGIECALERLMNELQAEYGTAHFTVLLPKRIISTIKNEDDREEVKDNFFAWKNKEVGDVINRMRGLNTIYYPLDGEYNGGHVTAAILVAEIPSRHLDADVVSMFAMLSLLLLRTKKKEVTDGLTGLLNGSILLQKIRENNAQGCVCLIYYSSIQQITNKHGWNAGNDKILSCIQDWKEHELYYLNRDTFALYIEGDISVAYDYVYDKYSQKTEKPSVLLGEITQPLKWDKLGVMSEEIRGINGINILKNKCVENKKEQLNLFTVTGMPFPDEDMYTIESVQGDEAF